MHFLRYATFANGLPILDPAPIDPVEIGDGVMYGCKGGTVSQVDPVTVICKKAEGDTGQPPYWKPASDWHPCHCNIK